MKEISVVSLCTKTHIVPKPLIQLNLNPFQIKELLNGIIYKCPLAPMGVLAPGSAHARPSARPLFFLLLKAWMTLGNVGNIGNLGNMVKTKSFLISRELG